MTALPASCPRCKAVFPFHGINVTSPSQVTVTLKGNKTKCPNCGYDQAEISDAVYSANSSVVTVLSAPESSRAVIEAFMAIVEDAAKGHISSEEAKQKAENLSPQYASTLERYYTLGVPGLALLISILQLYLQYFGNQPSSKDFERLSNAITEQTFVLKHNHYVSGIQRNRSRPPQANAGKKPVPKVHKSERRKLVRYEKRKALKMRRETFGGARTH